MDNLVCEFCPALDMVLRLHAPLQVWHTSDEGVNVGVEILNNFHRVLSLHSGRKTITLIKVRRDGGEQYWKCSDFPWPKWLQHINGAVLTGVFWSWQKFFLLVVLHFYCQFGYRGLSRWKKEPVQNHHGDLESETRMEGHPAKVQMGMSGGHCPPGWEITLSELDGLVDTPS